MIAGSSKRLEQLTATHSDSPSAPLPVSPKAVYRLAHLFELEELKATALDNLSSQLTVDNIWFEALGEMADYEEVQKLLEEYLVKNWASAKKSKAMAAAQKELAAGTSDEKRSGDFAGIVFRVMSQL